MKQPEHMIDRKDMVVAQQEDTYDLSLAAEKAAAAVGCHVVNPEPHQLQIDIDSEEAFYYFNVRLVEFEKHSNYGVTIKTTPSKSGLPRRHVVLDVYERNGDPHVFDEYERIAIQAALGSDIIRETLNVWRHLAGHKHPTRFFEKNE